MSSIGSRPALPPRRGTRGCGPYTGAHDGRQRGRHHENLVEELIASVETYNPGVDRELIRRAFEFAEARHRGQGATVEEAFIHHPWGCCPYLRGATRRAERSPPPCSTTSSRTRRPSSTRCAPSSTPTSRCSSRASQAGRGSVLEPEQAEAENYRMIVAMAQDVRVISHHRPPPQHADDRGTSESRSRCRRRRRPSRSTRLARLGIHALKWELRDISFQILHPRKYAEIKAMVADRR